MAFKHSDTLRKEIALWLAEGLISEEQAQKLIERYELDKAQVWYKDSGNILKALAILLVTMGIFLVISANWESIPTFGRMMLGLVPLLAAYAVSFYCYQKEDWKGVELALYFASLVFGANIALQSQIFHISSYFPNGLLFWILAAMPLVLYFRSAMYVLSFLALYVLWLGFQTEFEQFNVISLLILASFGLVLYRNPQQVGTVFFGFALYGCLVNLVVYLRRDLGFFDSSSFYFFVSFTAAFVLFYQSLLLLVRERLSEIFIRQLSSLLRLILVFWVFLFTFPEIADDFYRSWGKATTWYWEVYILAISGTVLFLFLAPRNLESLVNWLISAFFFATFLVTDDSWYCFIANLSFLAYAIWKIYHGMTSHDKASFMWGVFYLLVWAVGKYLALVADYATTAIILIVCGVGTYFINKLWDKRHEK